MAKLKIFAYPDLILTQLAKPLDRVEKYFFKVADDMLETMYEAPGIGLAANQVGILQRMIVLDTEYDYEELEGGEGIIKNRKPRIIFNPEIIKREGSILFNEGCLSVPEFNAEVKRSEKITLQYQDIDGLTQTLMADGLLAVAIQHEIDHLDGKLFIDRLSSLKKEMVRKKLRQERTLRESEDELLIPPRKSGKKKGF